jgi:hypothetical protein
MDKKIIVLGIVGLAAAFYVSQENSEDLGNSDIERQFRLSDGRVIKESELPQLGYTETPEGWVLESLLNELVAESERSKLSAGDWANIFNAIASAAGAGGAIANNDDD